ncbi:MAG TPA: DUF531 family protein [Candidatus Thermoplasmatota archaeon]|nr:DUF531 family protein [Candidatus Thermoplasmatota archaeon]
MPGRLTIGLYNSYDPRKLHEAHRRALARAAPLALAFDANLATFGFPFHASAGDLKVARGGAGAAAAAPLDLRTPLDVARFVAGTTSIGEGGDYFVELAKLGRFQLFPFPERGFPPQLGEVVLTTEHARCPRDTSARAVARALVDGRSQLLVFGLGPHGVPKDVHAMAAWELDITASPGQGGGSGRAGAGPDAETGGYSLETATALGAVVGAIFAHVEALEATPAHVHRR